MWARWMMWGVVLGCSVSQSPIETIDIRDSGGLDTSAKDALDSVDTALLDAYTITEGDTTDAGYGWAEYEVRRFSVAEILAPDGEPARFHVLMPQNPSESHPLMLDLHGGSLDVDDAENPIGKYERCTSEYTAEKVADRLQKSRFTHLFASRGWIVVMPENPFCDAWVGQGPDDPVDTSHAGFLLAELSVDHVREIVPISAVSVSGTSLGALGVSWFANHTHHDLQTLIVDSGATDAIRYYTEKGYSPIEPEEAQGRFAHILGGPPYDEDGTPSEFYDRYVALSILPSVTSGEIRTPMLHTWSMFDAGSPSIQHEDLAATLIEHYDKDGIRWSEYPLHHRLPGHPQLHASTVPYLVWAAAQFAEGRALQIIEAENTTGALGAVWMDEPDVWPASGNGVRRVLAASGSGQLLSVDVTVPPGEMSVATFLSVSGASSPGLPVATLYLHSGETVLTEQTLTVEDLTPMEGDMAAMMQSIAQATLSTSTSGGEVTISVDVMGNADVDADVMVVTHAHL